MALRLGILVDALWEQQLPQALPVIGGTLF